MSTYGMRTTQQSISIVARRGKYTARILALATISGPTSRTYDLWRRLLRTRSKVAESELRCAKTIHRAGYTPDSNACGVNDVVGTRCDPYSHRLATGKMSDVSCHQLYTNKC